METEIIADGAYAYFFILSNADGMLLGMRQDGTMEYGDGYEPDEAARIFWEAVTRAQAKSAQDN